MGKSKSKKKRNRKRKERKRREIMREIVDRWHEKERAK